MSLKDISKLFIVVLVCLLSVGCKPRGETISLDQSLEIAKQRFANARLSSQSKLPSDVSTSLDTLKADLERLSTVSSLQSYQQESKTIAEALKPLVAKSGYASRVSIEEIYKQYVMAAENSPELAFAPGTAKLLAQRTYHVLSSELENTRFAL